MKKKNQGENYGTSTGFAQKNKEDQENNKIKIKMELFLFRNKLQIELKYNIIKFDLIFSST